MQAGAAQGAVGVSIASFSENGGPLQNPLSFPMPLNASGNSSSTTSTSGRKLLQQTPYVDSNLQVVCRGCNDTSALQAALTSATPAALFNLYAAANGTPSCQGISELTVWLIIMYSHLAFRCIHTLCMLLPSGTQFTFSQAYKLYCRLLQLCCDR